MRFVKQLIYGILYLSVIGGIAFGVYKSGLFVAPTCFDSRLNQGEVEVDCGGANCESCELKHLQPIRAVIQYFPIGTNTNAVVIFSNPNLNYGATFGYTLNFYDAGHQLIHSLTKESVIYPAEAVRVIVESNLPFSAGRVVGTPEVLVVSPSWKPAAGFQAPSIQVRQVVVTVSGTQATITGILSNRESFALAEAAIGALVASRATQAPVGASKTILQRLQPFEERSFRIIVPLATKLKLSEINTRVYSWAKR